MVVFMDVSFQPCLDQIAATADAICARAVRASFQSQRFDGGQVPIALRTGMQNRLALRASTIWRHDPFEFASHPLLKERRDVLLEGFAPSVNLEIADGAPAACVDTIQLSFERVRSRHYPMLKIPFRDGEDGITVRLVVGALPSSTRRSLRKSRPSWALRWLSGDLPCS
jgi:hypothetical protein